MTEVKYQIQWKAPKFARYKVTHYNIGVTKVLFHSLFASWRDARLLDIGAICHMNLQSGFFEDFNDNVDGMVYFADKASLKLLGLGTIKLKLLGFPNFLLHDVLYILELWRNFLSFVHIRQQVYTIHIFDGKVEIRKVVDNMVAMTGVEEERLLELKMTSAQGQNFAYLSHCNEGTLPSSTLWHARFGHINYDNLRLWKGMIFLICLPFLGNWSNAMLIFLESTTNNPFMIPL